METKNREEAILSTFLFADDCMIDKKDAFKLNPDIFTTSFKRALANKINDEMEDEQMMGGLLLTLEDHTIGTKNELEFLDIMAQNAIQFTVAERMHTRLIAEYKNRVLKAMR